MTSDEKLRRSGPDTLRVWAPIHAWRVLGQLRAAEAVEPLIGLLHRIDDEDDDWVDEELALVFGLLGAAAIPALSNYLADSTPGLYARTAAARALSRIAHAQPDQRDECIQKLSQELEQYHRNDPTLNLISSNAWSI
jgi:HEAT repeat protein